jgi:hypothetical protein
MSKVLIVNFIHERVPILDFLTAFFLKIIRSHDGSMEQRIHAKARRRRVVVGRSRGNQIASAIVLNNNNEMR